MQFLHRGSKTDHRKISRTLQMKEMSFKEDDDKNVRIDEYQNVIFNNIRLKSRISNEEIYRSFDPDVNHRIFKKQLN